MSSINCVIFVLSRHYLHENWIWSNSGIQGFGDLGIEANLSLLYEICICKIIDFVIVLVGKDTKLFLRLRTE